PDYEAYSPSPKEKALVAGLLEKAPLKQALKASLLGVYFVKNLRGNGITTPLFTHDGPVYAWVAINPAAFDRSLSEVLSAREQSVFVDGEKLVKVECAAPAGKQLPGVAYSLGHEIAHTLDYSLGVTPYQSEDYYMMRTLSYAPGFVFGPWVGYDKLSPGADSRLRKELRFYGIGGKPKLGRSDVKPLYTWLAASPALTLYGSQNWAEDFAEKFNYAYLSSLNGGQRTCRTYYKADTGWEEVLPSQAAADHTVQLFGSLRFAASGKSAR
ncbi:MAG TPA: hypothetical protein PLL10_10560, partial [Elusimicrobiales bacterium]|nr:hypothetical protein [Elusimicrobiales bacterium]